VLLLQMGMRGAARATFSCFLIKRFNRPGNEAIYQAGWMIILHKLPTTAAATAVDSILLAIIIIVTVTGRKRTAARASKVSGGAQYWSVQVDLLLLLITRRRCPI
jgi:hypothetical protein